MFAAGAAGHGDSVAGTMRDHTGRNCYGYAFAAYGLAWYVLASPWFSGKLTIPYDAKAHFQAQLNFLSNALQAGQSPFWTPYVFAGSPQIADPQSLIFSPALIIAYLVPQPGIAVVDAYALGLLGIAGLAVMMFFKDRHWHPIAAVIAALAFTFGASAAWRIQHIGQIQSYAFFAIALWTLTRSLERSSVAWGVAAGLASGLMIIEPDQVALLGGYALAAVTVAHLINGSGFVLELRRSATVIAAAGISGALFAAVPLLLTWLFVEQSNRPDVAFSAAVRGSLHPASLLTAVVNDLYGAFDPKVEYWGPYSASWDPSELSLSQNMSQLYIGALPVVLLLCVGVVRGAAMAREIRVYSLLLLGMIVYALGSFTPVFQVLHAMVPGVHLFRRPADATFLIGALASILAGYLAHRLLTSSLPRATGMQRALQVGVLAFPLLAGLSISVWQGHFADALKPTSIAVPLIGVSYLIVWGVEHASAAHIHRWLAVLTLVMVGDLRFNNGPNESTALTSDRYEFMKPNGANPTVQLLKSKLRQAPSLARRDRVELVGLGFSWPNVGLIHGFEHVLGYNPLRMSSVTDAVGADDSIAGWEQRRFTPLFPSYRCLLADMLGLRFIATSVPIETIDKRLMPGDLHLIARTNDAFIYENEHTLPRVSFVSQWQEADFGKLMATGRWPAFDPRSTVLLEAPPFSHPKVTAASLQQGGTVRITRYENTIIEVDVQASRSGFLLVNNVWHPWWRATVDGAPAEYLKANVLFAAVPVPSGHHRVHLEFEPLTGALDQLMGRGGVSSVATRRKQGNRRPRA